MVYSKFVYFGFMLISIYFMFMLCSCACTKYNDVIDVEGDNTGATSAKLLKLEALSLSRSYLLFSDLGVRNGYAPPFEATTLIASIALDDQVEATMLERYDHDDKDSQHEVSAEFVFPLLDILLIIEDKTGISTQATRQSLWNRWRGKYWYFDVLYAPTLGRYEKDIRRHQKRNPLR